MASNLLNQLCTDPALLTSEYRACLVQEYKNEFKNQWTEEIKPLFEEKCDGRKCEEVLDSLGDELAGSENRVKRQALFELFVGLQTVGVSSDVYKKVLTKFNQLNSDLAFLGVDTDGLDESIVGNVLVKNIGFFNFTVKEARMHSETDPYENGWNYQPPSPPEEIKEDVSPTPPKRTTQLDLCRGEDGRWGVKIL
jgi:hypothetical protein